MKRAGLRLRPVGIDTHQEFVIYMRRDCHVCRAEGFEAQTGDNVQRGMPLFTLHAEALGELAYAKHYLATHRIITLADEVTP